MKTNWSKKLIYFACCLSIISCLFAPSNQILATQIPYQTNSLSTADATGNNLNNHWSKLLGQCQLPCWIGIVPGQTSSTEAIALLKKHYGNSNVKVKNQTSIEWVSGGIDLSETGNVSMFENAVADIIVILKEDLSVDEVVRLFGEPDLVFVAKMGNDGNCWNSSLFYSKQGIEVSLKSIDGSVGIKNTQSVYSIRFLSPQLAVQWEPTDSIIAKWDGYQDYCTK